MATPGKPVKKETKRHILSKTSFNSPFTSEWSNIPTETMIFILKTVRVKLLSVGLVKKEVKLFRPCRKKKGQKTAATSEPAPQDPQVCDSNKNGWTNLAARRQLAIGINEVTKALERNELTLLLVCKSVRPWQMTTHLMALSATRGVPACQVPRLSLIVSVPLGLKSVLALGFKKCSSKDNDVFADTVEAIIPRVPAVDVAWLQGAPVRVTPEEDVGIKKEEEDEKMEEEDGEKRGQKRKLQTESEVIPASPSFSVLQPLKVKKIVANPAKKRKVKPKKNPVK